MQIRDNTPEIGTLLMGFLRYRTIVAFAFEGGQATGYAIAAESRQSLGQTVIGVGYIKPQEPFL
jgi:hypothetical protein